MPDAVWVAAIDPKVLQVNGSPTDGIVPYHRLALADRAGHVASRRGAEITRVNQRRG